MGDKNVHFFFFREVSVCLFDGCLTAGSTLNFFDGFLSGLADCTFKDVFFEAIVLLLVERECPTRVIRVVGGACLSNGGRPLLKPLLLDLSFLLDADFALMFGLIILGQKASELTTCVDIALGGALSPLGANWCSPRAPC